MPDKQNSQPKHTRALVITRTTFFDVDKIVSAIVLGKLLSKQPGVTVDLYLGDKVPVSTVTGIVAPQDVNFREKLTPDYFTVSIHRGNARVREVKWEETPEDLKLIIYAEQGQFNPQEYKLSPGTPTYDSVYTLGVKSKEEAQNALGEFASLWQSAQTFNLDIRAENQRYAGNNYIYADAKSFAECVFKFARERELEVSNTEATELLSCIYWKTNALRNRYTTFDTLGTVQQLIQNGGSVAEAVSDVFSTFSIVEVRARQDIYKSMKLTTEKIAFAQVSVETARQLSKIQPINPEKNPLFKLKDAITSFVMVPVSENSTLVLCSSRDERINLKRLFSNFNYVGDPLQAELSFNMNVADTEKEIKRILLKVFPQSQQPAQPASPANANPETPQPEKPTAPEPAAIPAPTADEPIPPADIIEAETEGEAEPVDLHSVLPTDGGEVLETTAAPLPVAPESEPQNNNLVMVEVPAPMTDLGPADPLPSAT